METIWFAKTQKSAPISHFWLPESKVVSALIAYILGRPWPVEFSRRRAIAFGDSAVRPESCAASCEPRANAPALHHSSAGRRG
jgi:hypothetical protein